MTPTKGDKFNHIEVSHTQVPFESRLILRNLSQQHSARVVVRFGSRVRTVEQEILRYA